MYIYIYVCVKHMENNMFCHSYGTLHAIYNISYDFLICICIYVIWETARLYLIYIGLPIENGDFQ